MRPSGMLFIPFWIGLLALPFVGWLKALGIAGVIGLGNVIWFWTVRWSQTPGVQSLASRVRHRAAPLLRWRPVPRQRNFLFTAFMTGLLLIPLELNDYVVDVLTLAGIYVVLALGLNIVVGMAGLLDLGYVSFYAIGAYTYALGSTELGISFWLGLPLGGLAAAGFGLLLGVITLRLRGDYIAIVTLGFIQIVPLILNNWDNVTNGPNGILNIGRPALGDFVLNRPIHFYYLILTMVCLTVFAVIRLNQSRIGRAWIAIREDEIAAQAVGVNTTQMKLLAFSLGAVCAGLAGFFSRQNFHSYPRRVLPSGNRSSF